MDDTDTEPVGPFVTPYATVGEVFRFSDGPFVHTSFSIVIPHHWLIYLIHPTGENEHGLVRCDDTDWEVLRWGVVGRTVELYPLEPSEDDPTITCSLLGPPKHTETIIGSNRLHH